MSFFGSLQSARRPSAGQYIAGVWQNGAWASFTFVGTIQPLSGQEYDKLPEGRRETAAYSVITTTALRGLDSTVNPDHVLAFGDWCEVVRVEPWQSGILPHYRCIVQRLNDQTVVDPPEPEGDD